MGRKPILKYRKRDDSITQGWIEKILPHFQQHGFRKFRMDEIVQLVGVSKATFYKYFSSREKLLDGIISHKLNEIAQFREVLFNQEQTYYERYHNAIRVSSQAMSQISGKFLEDIRHVYPEKWKAVEEFKNYAVSVLEEFYQEGNRNGYLLNIHPRIMAVNDHLFFTQMTDPEFLQKTGLSLQEMFDHYFRMKNEGVIRHRDKFEEVILKYQHTIS